MSEKKQTNYYNLLCKEFFKVFKKRWIGEPWRREEAIIKEMMQADRYGADVSRLNDELDGIKAAWELFKNSYVNPSAEIYWNEEAMKNYIENVFKPNIDKAPNSAEFEKFHRLITLNKELESPVCNSYKKTLKDALITQSRVISPEYCYEYITQMRNYWTELHSFANNCTQVPLKTRDFDVGRINEIINWYVDIEHRFFEIEPQVDEDFEGDWLEALMNTFKMKMINLKEEYDMEIRMVPQFDGYFYEGGEFWKLYDY